MRGRGRLGFFVLLLVGVGGCGGNNRPAGPAALTVPTTLTAFHSGAALTEDECRPFARQFEKAVQAGDARLINDLIDYDTLLEVSLQGVDLPPAVRRDCLREARSRAHGEGEHSRGSLGAELAEGVESGGQFRLVRLHTESGQMRALYRLSGTDDRLNYHDAFLIRKPDGQIRIGDVYVYGSGERLSETMRRILLPLAASASAGLTERLFGRQQLLVKHSKQVDAMLTAFGQERMDEGKRLYQKLPAELQADKSLLLARLGAASRADDDEEATAALEELLKHHANEPCVDIWSIGRHRQNKELDRALACVERLDRAVGGDPYLELWRSTIHREAGDFARARQAAERAIQRDPDNQDAYWALIHALLRQKDFAETVRQLDRLTTRFEIELDDLTQLPDYADFVQSPEYKNWIARRPSP
jgi:tetratricopeptide (TPR) repeat protein